MRTIALCCIAPLLGGCWFVFIPGSVIGAVGDSISGTSGQHCVTEAASVGSKIKMQDGRIGTVMKLEGHSMR
jgi:ABC-type phosphonate transport system ATPase subunit